MSEGMPVDVAASAHQLAEQLHAVLLEEMKRKDPAPEVLVLWQTAKLINTAVGALNYDSTPEDKRHLARWWDVAEISAIIARDALQAAGRNTTIEQAAAYLDEVERSKMDGATMLAYETTVQLSLPDVEPNPATLTASIDSLSERWITATADRGPAPQIRPHTTATMLLTAHTVTQLGAAVADVVIPGD